jgi:TctA family transporter
MALFGAFAGMLPSLGPINGVALLLPLTLALDLPPETALILLAAVYLGCEYGGRISAILLNVPDDAAAVMTTLDGYPLARQGKAGIALSRSALMLGVVLGELMEDNLRRALSISAGDLNILWNSPISLCLWALTAVMLGLPGLRWWRARRAAQLANTANA